ncbi:Hint domain-containing protein [Rhodobacter sp. KR11]|uniref:Hint domain-containing protein n=1 Tax=Rhodobacter sp. KR11 TaxID=2974588 RepID=UPI00222280AF|nr:Hint domain-containing protein [Rhodobacter sp. KR11]MCW1918471.1 Hint domain-containing protein [Rhodobacter sp. KR11]
MGRHDPALTIAISGRAGLARGLYAGTVLRTPLGWAAIESLCPGELVLSRDRGLCPVVSLTREERPALWAVRIPAGALENTADLLLPPGQPVLVQTDFAMPYTGEAEALVPASSLEGWRGILPVARATTLPIWQVRLDRASLIECGPGVVVGLEGSEEAKADLLTRLMAAPQRPVLPLAAARHLVATLIGAATGLGLAQAARG